MKTLSVKRRRDIGRQRWQFVAVVVTVVLGVAMFAGTFNAYLNLGKSLAGTYDRMAMADMIVTGSDDGWVDTVANIEGVADAIERRRADVPFTIGEHELIGRVVGIPVDGQPDIDKVDVDAGSYLLADDPTGVLLESHAAKDFDLSIDDTFTITGHEVTIVGIVTSPEYLWPARDEQSMLTPPKTFAVVFASEDLLEQIDHPIINHEVLVLYDTDVDTAGVDSAVEGSARSANASATQPLADQPSNNAISSEISGLQTMAVAFPLLFLTAAGMAIYVLITRLVFSQRGVIGTLRASGFDKRTLSRHYRSYGIRVGIIGAAIGAVLGGFLARGMTALYTQIFGIPDLVAALHIPTAIIALAFGAIAGGIASIAPSRTVIRMAPAEAMRGDTPLETGKRSLFETLIPPLRGAPVRWRMTLRGLGRNKKRSGTMVVGVVLAMTLILATAGMMDTLLSAMNRQFEEISLEDASVVFEVPVTAEMIDRVGAVEGVAAAEPVIGLSATLSKSDRSYSTSMQGYERNTVMHGFPEPLPTSGIFVGQAVSDLLDAEVGDQVRIELPDINTTFTAIIERFLDEPLATVAYMSREGLENAVADANPAITPETFANPVLTTAQAVFEAGTSKDAVLANIRDVDGVAVAIDATQLRETVEQFQAFLYAFIAVMLVFGGAMAFALIFNIISVNVAERSSEFASMRANGLTHRRVAALIAGETLILTAIGIIPGLLVGWWAAGAFLTSVADAQLPIQADISPATYLVTTAVMFVVAGLSLIPAIRAVKRINVGEIVRERSV